MSLDAITMNLGHAQTGEWAGSNALPRQPAIPSGGSRRVQPRLPPESGWQPLTGAIPDVHQTSPGPGEARHNIEQTLPVPNVDAAKASGPHQSAHAGLLQHHTDLFEMARGRAAAALIQMGLELIKARQALHPLGMWHAFLSEHVHLQERSVRQLIRIANYPPFVTGDNVAALLPGDRVALELLAQIPEEDFQPLLQDYPTGFGHRDRSEIAMIVKDRMVKLGLRQPAAPKEDDDKADARKAIQLVARISKLARGLPVGQRETVVEALGKALASLGIPSQKVSEEIP